MADSRPDSPLPPASPLSTVPLDDAGVPEWPGPLSFANFSHFKPELLGVLIEDVEGHLLRTNDWMKLLLLQEVLRLSASVSN